MYICSTVVAKNGTRMENHIKKCVKCADDTKHKYVCFSKEKETTAASSEPLMTQASSSLMET